jgi:ethanolamine utilization protein EutA (predicted chaperonin)
MNDKLNKIEVANEYIQNKIDMIIQLSYMPLSSVTQNSATEELVELIKKRVDIIFEICKDIRNTYVENIKEK